MLQRMTSVLEKPVLEGIEQNIFHTQYPIECIESILLLGHMMFDCNTFEWDMEEYPKKIEAFLCNIEKITGAKEGVFKNYLQMFGK
jgi:hypothetical protein